MTIGEHYCVHLRSGSASVRLYSSWEVMIFQAQSTSSEIHSLSAR